jgi:hypothetical protein
MSKSAIKTDFESFFGKEAGEEFTLLDSPVGVFGANLFE